MAVFLGYFMKHSFKTLDSHLVSNNNHETLMVQFTVSFDILVSHIIYISILWYHYN